MSELPDTPAVKALLEALDGALEDNAAYSGLPHELARDKGRFRDLLAAALSESAGTDGRSQAALELISQYGSIDGEHHKTWVIDQVVRILAPDYATWVREQKDGEDGPDTYRWEEGIPP